MKINGKQLSHYLQQSLAPLYLISGDEPLLVHEACVAVYSAAKKTGYLEKQRFSVEANFNWDYLVNEISTLSLFNQKRFIEIYVENSKISEYGSKILQGIASQPPVDVIVLIKAARLTAAIKASAWYKAIDKKAIVVSIWPLSPLELPVWIKQRLQQHQLQTTTKAIDLIASCCEGNLLAAQQTIEKLQLIYPMEKLSYDDVAAAIIDHSHYSVFDLTDAIFLGKAAQIVKIIEELKGRGIEPILLLWCITKEIRLLIKLLFGLKTHSLDTILQKHYIREQQKPLIRQCLQKHTAQTLNRLLQQGLQIDQAIKGISQHNIWDELLLLSLAFAGINKVTG